MNTKFEEREFVVFQNQGQKIFGVFHAPIDPKKKVPAVLLCHGFAGNKLGRYKIYVLLAERLAKAGIASLRFDFRGSGESEGNFSDMTVESEVSDALEGLNFLRSHPGIDINQIGILGNSFGGAIAVLAASQDQNIRSIALLAPLFNSSQWKKKWELIMANSADAHAFNEMTKMLDGNAPGAQFYPSFFKLDLSKPLHSLSSIPLLHIHSIRDERIGSDQTDLFKACRQNASAESKWITLNQCDHNFGNAEERQMIVEETANWFSNTLK